LAPLGRTPRSPNSAKQRSNMKTKKNETRHFAWRCSKAMMSSTIANAPCCWSTVRFHVRSGTPAPTIARSMPLLVYRSAS
jgi:hypothetical protein